MNKLEQLKKLKKIDELESSLDDNMKKIDVIGKVANEIIDLKPMIESMTGYETVRLDPTKQYVISDTIQLKSHVKILGGYGIDEYVKSTIKFNGTGDMFTSSGQLSLDIRDCIFEGNLTNNGINVVSQRLHIEKCTFKNFDKALTITTNGLNVVENMISKCHFYDNNYGIYNTNTGGTNSDGWVVDCIFKGSKICDLYGKDFDGWNIQGNHFYSGSATCNINIRGFFVKIINNYFEHCKTNINLRIDSSTLGTVIISNNLFLKTADVGNCIAIDNSIPIDNILITDNVFKNTISEPTLAICIERIGSNAELYATIINNVRRGFSEFVKNCEKCYVTNFGSYISTNGDSIEFNNQQNTKRYFKFSYGNPSTAIGNITAGSLVVDYQNADAYLSYGTGYKKVPFAKNSVSQSTATDVGALKTDLNTLITALKNAGVIF